MKVDFGPSGQYAGGTMYYGYIRSPDSSPLLVHLSICLEHELRRNSDLKRS